MSELQFTPVEVGDMSEIPPDAPDGDWVASVKVKVAATAKDNLPMLVLDYRLEECATEGNESFPLPTRVSKFLVVRAANDPYVKMFRQDLAAICAGHNIPVPKFTAVRSAADFDEFIADLTANRVVVRTKNKADKKTGEVRTEIGYPKKAAESNVEEMPRRKKKSA